MTILSLESINATDLPIPGADPWYASPEDPAITVMTDFRERHSVTVSEDLSVDAALEHMKHAGVRCAFVTNQAQRVTGLVTAYDIMSEKPMRHLQSVAVRRKDVEVRDIMLRMADWKTLAARDLERVTVGEIHDLFQSTGLTHIPVFEGSGGEPRKLRGLLSASHVRRLLSKSMQERAVAS